MKLLLTFFAAALLAAPSVSAQGMRFPYPLPDSNRVEVLRDVPYFHAGDSVVVMDVHRPVGLGAARLPVIVFLNTNVGRSQRAHPVYTGWGAAATSHGFVGIMPDAAPDFGTGLDALLDHLVRNAAGLGIDPERIAVYAASGNVPAALPAIASPARSRIRAAALYYGFSDSLRFRLDLPLLVVRAGLDRPGMNDGIDKLVAAGLRANAPLSVINVSHARHAFEVLDDHAGTRDAIDRTFAFFQSALAPASRASLLAGLPRAEAAGAVSRGDLAHAAALYASLVAANPADASLRLAYAEALLQSKRIREARAEFEKLKGSGLGYRDLGVPAARAAAAEGDAAGAIAWLESIPKRFRPAALRDDTAFAALRGREEFEALFR